MKRNLEEKQFIDNALKVLAVYFILIAMININHLVIDYFMNTDFTVQKCKPAGHSYALPSDDCKPAKKNW